MYIYNFLLFFPIILAVPTETSTQVEVIATTTAAGSSSTNDLIGNPCMTVGGLAAEECIYTEQGWRVAAATYIADNYDGGNYLLPSVEGDEFGNPTFSAEAGSFFAGPGYATNKVTGRVTFELGHATFMTNPTLRSELTSIWNVALSIQNNPTYSAAASSAQRSNPVIIHNKLGLYVTAGVAIAVAVLAIGL